MLPSLAFELTDQPFPQIIDASIVALHDSRDKRDFGMEGMRYRTG